MKNTYIIIEGEVDKPLIDRFILETNAPRFKVGTTHTPFSGAVIARERDLFNYLNLKEALHRALE